MQNRLSCMSEWVPKTTGAPPNNGPDEWKAGEWTRTTGVCKIARGGREGTPAATGPKKGVWDAEPREESSFETLDLRAAEVLDKR